MDPTAAHFGWEDWFWSRKEYEEKLVGWTLDLVAVDAGEQIWGLNERDWILRATKEVIEECVEEWEKEDRSGKVDDEVLPEVLADQVRTRVFEALADEHLDN